MKESRVTRAWFGDESPPFWAYPLAGLFRVVVFVRRALYRVRMLPAKRIPVPVIVIGNIVVGGTGKTPLTIHLVEKLRQAGLRSGVISRGYGGKPQRIPLLVTAGSSPNEVGDEPVLIARRTGAPVCIHPRRALAAEALLAEHGVDVLLCDDGLQHYALERDIEIAVIDSSRGVGNGRMLPAGPLREPVKRLATVDYVVLNGSGDVPAADGIARHARMRLQPAALVNLKTGEREAIDALSNESCAAIAGIGNPQRFFSLLSSLGYETISRAFPDHHPFTASDFEFAGNRPVLMTEKDAVKCVPFAQPDWWYLEVAATLDDPGLVTDLVSRLKDLGRDSSGRNHAE